MEKYMGHEYAAEIRKMSKEELTEIFLPDESWYMVPVWLIDILDAKFAFWDTSALVYGYVPATRGPGKTTPLYSWRYGYFCASTWYLTNGDNGTSQWNTPIGVYLPPVINGYCKYAINILTDEKPIWPDQKALSINIKVAEIYTSPEEAVEKCRSWNTGYQLGCKWAIRKLDTFGFVVDTRTRTVICENGHDNVSARVPPPWPVSESALPLDQLPVKVHEIEISGLWEGRVSSAFYYVQDRMSCSREEWPFYGQPPYLIKPLGPGWTDPDSAYGSRLILNPGGLTSTTIHPGQFDGCRRKCELEVINVPSNYWDPMGIYSHGPVETNLVKLELVNAEIQFFGVTFPELKYLILSGDCHMPNDEWPKMPKLECVEVYDHPNYPFFEFHDVPHVLTNIEFNPPPWIKVVEKIPDTCCWLSESYPYMPRESALYRKRRNGPGPRGLLKERVVFPAVNYESSWPYYVANTFIEKYVRYYVLVFGPGPDLIDVPEKYKPETVTEVVESVRQLKPETGDQFDPWGCICDMDMMCLPREMLSERCLATYESKTEEKSESGDEDEPDTESDTSGMKVIDHLGNTYLVRNGSYDCCMNELYPNAQELLLKNEWKRPIYCQYPCSGQAFYEDGLKLVSPRMEARNGAWEKSSFSCPYKVTYDCNGPLMKTPGFVTYSNGAVATVYKE